MKPGDIVQVKPTSDWRGVIGDAEGRVLAVVKHTRRASVRFEALGLTAEVWGWEEFTIVIERDEAELR